MPMFINDRGKEVWFPENSKPAVHVGNPITQKEKLESRREGTIKATARAIKLGISEEELNEVIAKNALNVEMDPDNLRLLATQYLENEEAGSTNGVERE